MGMSEISLSGPSWDLESFSSWWQGCRGLGELAGKRGRHSELSLHQLAGAVVYQTLQGQGYVGRWVRQLWGISVSESALSQRRAQIPHGLFATIMAVVLKPLAQMGQHPEAFYHGLRLLGVDGTQFSVRNTPRILGEMTKAKSRRFEAAFAKVGLCALVELGLHNPLAAAIGTAQEHELVLASELLEKLPGQSLLIVDRLYGTAWTVHQLLPALAQRESHLLVRLRSQQKAMVVEVLEDGSAVVEIKVRDRICNHRIVQKLRLRQMTVRVQRKDAQVREIRLWTDLMDHKKYPALELAQLYTRRWEQELFYKQIKLDVLNTPLLRAQTAQTASQEVAALVLAAALVAQVRLRAAQSTETTPQRISYREVLWVVKQLWGFLALSGGHWSPQQYRPWIENSWKQLLQEAILPTRRTRSCPRAIRQPVRGWPRLLTPQSNPNPCQISIIPTLP